MVLATPTRDRSLAGAGRQRGAITVMAAVLVVVLVLMIGLVIDLGHLYVTKSELQNAADSCALSGAREMNDLSTGALERITAAAIKAGVQNKVDLQQDYAEILPADVTFADTLNGDFQPAVSASTRYIKCAPHASHPKSVVLWFMAITGLTKWDLSAYAKARTVGGQTFCAIPIAICTTATSSTPTFDFEPGTWYSGRLAAGTGVTGNYGWIRFNGQGSRTLGELLAGQGMCDVGPDRVDAEPGVSGGAAQAWNTRFGLYSGSWRDMGSYPPDLSGYAYTPDRIVTHGNTTSTVAGSWPAAPPQNAYADYLPRKNITHDPYNPTALLDNNGKPTVLPGNPSPLSQALHETMGRDRRMVFVPVIRCSEWQPNGKNMPVLDYACAFLLSPIDNPDTDVMMEFHGLKSQGACGTMGIPGDVGPPVPALVE